MGKRGTKSLERVFKDALEEDNMAAFKAAVISTLRVAVSDGFVKDPDTGEIVFDPKARHPDWAKANSEVLDRGLGKAIQQVRVEGEVTHRMPFMLTPELLALHGEDAYELEEPDGQGGIEILDVRVNGNGRALNGRKEGDGE